MKRDVVLSFGYLIFLLIIIGGTAFLPTAAGTIQATVVLDPEKINLSNPVGWSSPYMVATISLPKPYKNQEQNINASTVLLDGVIPLSRYDSSPGKFKAFFERQAVIDYLWFKTYHLGLIPPFKNQPVTLTVTGNLYDGTAFAGSDTVYVSAR